MRTVGIDPGKKGGIAWICPEMQGAIAMPISGKELDAQAIAEVLRDIRPDKIVIEKQGAMPGQGVVSMFTIGRNYGLLIGLGVQYSVEIITPQSWKKVVLAGTPKDKDAAIAYCRRAFPHISLLPSPRCKTLSDGIADALCIAEFGRRTFADGAIAS